MSTFKDVARKWVGGDDSVSDGVCQELRQAAFASARRHGAGASAEDIAQDTIMKIIALRGSGRLRPDNLLGLTRTIAANLSRDLHRKTKSRRAWLARIAVPIESPDVSEIISADEDAARVLAIIDRLSPMERALLEARLDGRSLRVVGAELGIPLGTAGGRTWRLIARLNEQLRRAA
jgi:RNA polymerase sigma factor (sigma-70 family)